MSSRKYFQIYLLFNIILFVAFQSYQGFVAYRTRQALDDFHYSQAFRAAQEALALMNHELFAEAINAGDVSLAKQWFIREMERIERSYFLKRLVFQYRGNQAVQVQGSNLVFQTLSNPLEEEGTFRIANDLGDGVVFVRFALEIPELFRMQRRTQQVGVILIGILFLLVMIAVRWLYQNLERLQIEMVETSRLAEFGKIAAGVAHDIRNPLGAITLTVAELKDLHEADGETLQYLHTVTREISRINHTLGTLLVFQRESLPMNQSVNLQDLIYEVLSIFAPDQEARIKIDGGDNSIPEIHGNRDLLFRMLENLIRNALESGSDHPSVTVKTHLEDNVLWLSVADNGLGMENWDKASTPFFTTKNYGTGLGLVVVKDAVSRHGARLKVESNHPGTRVSVGFQIDRAP